jgi:hypothetical protein
VVRRQRAASVLHTLDTGPYRVEVEFGDARAAGDVQVRSGVTVIETLDLSAGRVGLYGVLPTPGGPIFEPIEWTVREVASGAEIRDRTASSEWVLPVGTYRVEGRRGEWRGESTLVVRPGAESVLAVPFESSERHAASPDPG